MALTLQRKLELAGALSKVQPQLQRLHLLPEPKKRHRKRNAILIGSAIALAAVVAAGAVRRRGGSEDASPQMEGESWTGFPEPDAFAARPDETS
jgi:hypothetical protein